MLEEEFKLKEEAVRRSNETLALGQGALVSAARGIWWDCLGSKPVPLDVEHVEGSHLLLQRPHRRHRKDPAHPQRAQGPEVGPVGNLRGGEGVVAAMAGQEDHLQIAEATEA